jgi:hypothetical protein
VTEILIPYTWGNVVVTALLTLCFVHLGWWALDVGFAAEERETVEVQVLGPALDLVKGDWFCRRCDFCNDEVQEVCWRCGVEKGEQ